MRLYENTVSEFIKDVRENQISTRLTNNFKNYYLRSPGPGEINAWRNSSQYIANVLDKTPMDNMLIMEYELPYSDKRVDCMLFGKDESFNDNVILIELKQWSEVSNSEIENKVSTFVGGGLKDVNHPAYQVRGYCLYLKDYLEIFYGKNPANLCGCAYCHNYIKKARVDPLFETKFTNIINDYPVFTQTDYSEIGQYIKNKIGNGHGLEVFNRFSFSNIGPSKKLLEHVSGTIKGTEIFHLIDEQLEAYYTIIDRVNKLGSSAKKSVVIIKGGPGTGKSVIAINIMADMLSKGYKVYHGTGSKAFTETLRKTLGERAASRFVFFNSPALTRAKNNEIEILVLDEAHRIRKTSNNRFTRRIDRTDMSQIDQLINAAKLTIFFIDDLQIVRPDEIGNTNLIKETAAKFGADVFEFDLKTQFRCNGSDAYIDWINETLGIKETDHKILTVNDKVEFKIFEDPIKLREAIIEKNLQKANSARLVAGFCWKWSDPNPEGTLKEDIVIPLENNREFKATWEAKNEARKIAKGIPRAALWAHDPNGVNQVGSIYTIQGFEFDYVGVIFGKDLRYDPEKGWVGDTKNSADKSVIRAKENFVNYVKNTYRVLMSRGMKGCYVYFMDKNTENFFRSKINL